MDGKHDHNWPLVSNTSLLSAHTYRGRGAAVALSLLVFVEGTSWNIYFSFATDV